MFTNCEILRNGCLSMCETGPGVVARGGIWFEFEVVMGSQQVLLTCRTHFRNGRNPEEWMWVRRAWLSCGESAWGQSFYYFVADHHLAFHSTHFFQHLRYPQLLLQRTSLSFSTINPRSLYEDSGERNHCHNACQPNHNAPSSSNPHNAIIGRSEKMVLCTASAGAERGI